MALLSIQWRRHDSLGESIDHAAPLPKDSAPSARGHRTNHCIYMVRLASRFCSCLILPAAGLQTRRSWRSVVSTVLFTCLTMPASVKISSRQNQLILRLSPTRCLHALTSLAAGRQELHSGRHGFLTRLTKARCRTERQHRVCV